MSIFTTRVAPSLRSQVNPSTAEGTDPNLQIDPTNADSASGAAQPPGPGAAMADAQSPSPRFAQPAAAAQQPPAPAQPSAGTPPPPATPPAPGADQPDKSIAATSVSSAPSPTSQGQPMPSPWMTGIQMPPLSPDAAKDAETLRGITTKQQTIADQTDQLSQKASLSPEQRQVQFPNEPVTTPSKWRRFGAIAAGVASGALSMNPAVGIAQYENIARQPENLQQTRYAQRATGLKNTAGQLQEESKNLTTELGYNRLPIEQAQAQAEMARVGLPHMEIIKSPGTGQNFAAYMNPFTHQTQTFALDVNDLVPWPDYMKQTFPDMVQKLPTGAPPDLIKTLQQEMDSRRSAGSAPDRQVETIAAMSIAKKYGLQLDQTKPLLAQLGAEHGEEGAKLYANLKADPELRRMEEDRLGLQRQMTAFAGQRNTRQQFETTQKVYGPSLDADSRLANMLEDQKKKGDGSADLDMLYNHLGMTASDTKNARIVQATIEEARKARSLPEDIYQAWVNRPSTGGFLADRQKQQMIDLAVQKREQSWYKARREAPASGATWEPEQHPGLPPLKGVGGEAGTPGGGAPPQSAAPAAAPAAAPPKGGGGKAGWVIDPAGGRHYVTDVQAAIKLHPGTTAAQ